MWKNTVESGRLQTTVCCMLIACWIAKATHTHSDYVILIACPLQRLNITLYVNYPSFIVLALVLVFAWRGVPVVVIHVFLINI